MGNLDVIDNANVSRAHVICLKHIWCIFVTWHTLYVPCEFIFDMCQKDSPVIGRSGKLTQLCIDVARRVFAVRFCLHGASFPFFRTAWVLTQIWCTTIVSHLFLRTRRFFAARCGFSFHYYFKFQENFKFIKCNCPIRGCIYAVWFVVLFFFTTFPFFFLILLLLLFFVFLTASRIFFWADAKSGRFFSLSCNRQKHTGTTEFR